MRYATIVYCIGMSQQQELTAQIVVAEGLEDTKVLMRAIYGIPQVSRVSEDHGSTNALGRQLVLQLQMWENNHHANAIL